ncbi:MAG: hypothetical protein PHI18_02025, partial [bacterium]|nr:hypothetical protein [bacterium]
ILTLEQAVAAAKQQQIEKSQRARDAEQRRLEDLAKFVTLVDLSLQKLGAGSDEQFRQQRIADLQKELGLTQLTEMAIRQKAAALNLAAINALAEGTVSTAEIEKQKAALQELLGLLEQSRSKASEEIPLIGQAIQNATAEGTRSLVQMFTRGKVEAKQFADAMRNIFEQLISQLMARGILLMLSSLIPGFGPAMGIVGAVTGQGGGPAGVGFPGGTIPNLPTPARYLSGPDLSGWMQKMERTQRNLARDIARIAATPTEVVGVTVQGEVLRFSVKRAEAAAAKRKL